MKTKLLFITIISTFSLFSQIPSYVPTSGLVGWYPFNGNANDESGNNNNGTVNGAILTTDRFGNSNNSYLFNGTTNYISVSQAPFTNGPFTISSWINVNDLLIRPIIGLGELGSNNLRKLYFSGSLTNGRPSIGTAGANDITSSTNAINQNTWLHLSVVLNSYSTNNVLFYVNGVLISTTNTTQGTNVPLPLNNNGFCIGKSITDFFKGKLDDIGFWNRALTPQEITNLYVGCNLNPVIPILTNANIGQNAQIASNVTNCQYVWQSNPNNVGWISLPVNSSYSNVTTNNLSINNIQVSNHLQEFRVIATQGNCVDTSNVSTIIINDTCINTVNDTITTHITVTDTLLINVAFAGLTPPNNSNTIKVYPNPANDFVIIDNGNFAMMSGYSVKITNSLGATVFNSPINQAVFNVSTTTFGARGVYYIHILNSNNAIIDTREIVLQ